MEPRPSGTMILDIDEELATKDTRLEIKRSYPHVGNALIRTHKVEEGEPHGNVMSLLAMVSKEYMDDSEESQSYWDEIMERWIHSMFYNLGNCMQIYNRRQREIDGIELYFDRLELELQNREYILGFGLDSVSNIPADTATLATACRNALVSGKLGEGVKHVEMPSKQSAELQRACGDAIKAAREEAARIKAEEEAKAKEEEIERRRQEAEENFLENPDEEIAKEEEAEKQFGVFHEQYDLPAADYSLDFRFWDVYAPDGSVRQYDSLTGEFVEAVPEGLYDYVPGMENEVEEEPEVEEKPKDGVFGDSEYAMPSYLR